MPLPKHGHMYICMHRQTTWKHNVLNLQYEWHLDQAEECSETNATNPRSTNIWLHCAQTQTHYYKINQQDCWSLHFKQSETTQNIKSRRLKVLLNNASNATCSREQHAASYVYPARIFISEDFPAPLGPIIAVKWPEHKLPDIRFSIVLKPTTIHTPQLYLLS